jgi:hypothetical protein
MGNTVLLEAKLHLFDIPDKRKKVRILIPVYPVYFSEKIIGFILYMPALFS